MDLYIQTLQKPEFVLSVVVAIALIFFQPFFERLRSFFMSSLINSSGAARRLIRNIRARELKYIKNIRRNDAEVMYQVVRNYSFLILFMGAIGFYLAMITLGPLKGIGMLPTTVQYFIAAPIFVFEVLWLLQNARTRDLVLYRGKLRLTRRST